MQVPSRSLVAAACVVVLPLALGACAPRIGVTAAADATDPACAEVLLGVPDTLGEDLTKVRTTSQATAAWGEPGAAVTLRCGVTPPGPTTDLCQSVESEHESVDWVVLEDDDGTWTFTTYGRVPAVQVVVPPAVTAQHSTSFVADLGEAVSVVPATRACVGVGDLDQ